MAKRAGTAGSAMIVAMTDSPSPGPGSPPGSWTVHQSRTVYDGSPWVQVELADVTAPDGTLV